MGRLARLMISTAHLRTRYTLLGILTFIVLLLISGLMVHEQLSQSMRSEIARSLETYNALRDSAVRVFLAMDDALTAEPCSTAFFAQMRRIAFAPDGISELLYAPGGVVQCGAGSGSLAEPLDLGPPDVAASAEIGIALWLNRDLTPIGLDGLEGAIAVRSPYALIIPPGFLPPIATPDWMEQELVYHVGPDLWLHRSGTEGLHSSALAEAASPLPGLLQGVALQYACDGAREHCVAARASLGAFLAQRWVATLLVLSVLALLAVWLTQQTGQLVRRHWSFEARFLRNLDASSVLCVYQPVLNLRTDVVTACEVLARWRDVDGTIVPPDRFLGIIERRDLTMRFTRMVVDAAHADLAGRLPSGVRLQINFNIFPRDLRAEVLVPVFAPLLGGDSPFDVVVEIVETAEIDPATAQIEIEALEAAGIKVYIDDFGAGYSSMHNLARLSVDGVKLDRSFAMAPDHSVMARMLEHAIELVQASGRSLVVEGVETQDRLATLKANGHVDFAQGYGISRPLQVKAFLAYLEKHGPPPNRQSHLVA